MSHKLIIFPTPENARCELRHDAQGGIVLIGVPDTHSSGRKGISFYFTDDVPNNNGARLWISAVGKVSLDMRGIVIFQDDGSALFMADDFHLQDKIISPPLPFPIPPIEPPIPPISKSPLDIIKATQERGKFDLSTKDGCGKFTEACVTNLHGMLSNKYGHIKKIPPQNHYPEEPYVQGGNVHAVDAIMLLENHDDTNAGIYDIILSNESADAKPQFIYRGEPVPNLWYYPA